MCLPSERVSRLRVRASRRSLSVAFMLQSSEQEEDQERHRHEGERGAVGMVTHGLPAGRADPFAMDLAVRFAPNSKQEPKGRIAIPFGEGFRFGYRLHLA